MVVKYFYKSLVKTGHATMFVGPERWPWWVTNSQALVVGLHLLKRQSAKACHLSKELIQNVNIVAFLINHISWERIQKNCALGDKSLQFGMVLGMGIRFSKTTANKLW